MNCQVEARQGSLHPEVNQKPAMSDSDIHTLKSDQKRHAEKR